MPLPRTTFRSLPLLLVTLAAGHLASLPAHASPWTDALAAARQQLSQQPAADQPRLAAAGWSQLDLTFPVESDWMLQDLGLQRNDWLGGRHHILTATLKRIAAEQGPAANVCRQTINLLDGAPPEDPRWLELYESMAARRRIERLAALQAQSPRIMFVKHHNLGGSHYAYTEAQSDAQSERFYQLGSSLCELELKQGATTLRTIIHDPDGIIRDPQPNWPANKLLFAWKKSDRLDDYHLHELDLTTTPPQVRQITSGLGVADYEGAYLPDGRIVFSSTRCVQTVDCWWTEVSNLYSCDSDGRNIRRLGYDQVHTNYPQVMDDGRVTYTRWEYNDRGQIYPQPLFQMNPDGSGQSEFYGNNSFFPTSILHARGIPGTGKVVAILSGHHSGQSGKLAVIDPTLGRQENQGVQLIAPPRPTRADRIDAYGQQGEQWLHPWPLNEQEFLVAYRPDDGNPASRQPRYGGRFRIYWMHRDGRRELLASDPDISCDQPVPIIPRTPPRARTPLLSPNKPSGVYYVQDVYAGPAMQGVPRGTAKELRIIQPHFRAAGIRSNRNRGAAGGALVSTPVAVSNGTWDPKTILGSVPIHPDGSAMFEVPARTPVYFQILDANRRLIQTMRSWSTLRPGETFSCVGCHVDKHETPASHGSISLAMKAGPSKPTSFYGPPRGFSFTREIQPILDGHCIRCHDQRAPHDSRFSNNKSFSLTGATTPDRAAGKAWSDAYLALTNVPYTTAPAGSNNRPFASPATGHSNPLVNWHDIQSAPPIMPPYAAGSARSGLLKLLESGHYDAKPTREDLDKIAAWIDLLVPFAGDYQEGNCWTPQESAKYQHFLNKREQFAALEESNDPLPPSHPAAATIMDDNGRWQVVAIPARPNDPAVRRNAVTRDLDAYRNLACNPLDATNGKTFPHATTNSVCRNEPCFEARNAIDGQLLNRGHGQPPFQSWGPEPMPGLWWQVDFGRDVQLDKIVVVLRADFPHDGTWRKARVHFLPNGGSRVVDLTNTAGPQSFRLNRIVNARSIRFEPLDPQPHNESWCALTEFQAWGRDAIPQAAKPWQPVEP